MGWIADIWNIFDDSEEDAAWQQHLDNEAAANFAKQTTNAATNAANTSKDWRYQNLLDIIAAQRNLENQSYNQYTEAMKPAQESIYDSFIDYYNKSQGQLGEGYGTATDETKGALENAISALREGYSVGSTAGEAVNPYSDIIQNRLGGLTGDVNLNYDNTAAYDERQRRAQEQLNRQLLARGEFDSSEGLRQNQELIRDLEIQKESDLYNRALQEAELNRARSGEIASLISSGLNVEQVGSGLEGSGQQMGAQLADLYMTGGSNLANLATGLGTTQAGATQSFGQNITNLSNAQLADLINRNQQYYQSQSQIYGNQLGLGQDLMQDWTNALTSISTGQPVSRTIQTGASNIYDASMTNAAANQEKYGNIFSDLGQLFSGGSKSTSGSSVSSSKSNSSGFDDYLKTGNSKYFNL